MPYQSCKSILPKFLWCHIVDYLSLADIYKSDLINKQFDALIDWKKCFLKNRRGSIAIVKCNSRRIDNFWKYACYHYDIYNNINDTMKAISDNNILNSKLDGIPCFIYYKIFIKGGKFEDNNHKHRFDYTPCSIEIIGNKTIIYSSRAWKKISIYCPTYFSMKHIVVNGLMLSFRKPNNNLDNYITSTLHIYNCIFNYIRLYVSSIDIIAISSCTFKDSSLYINDSDYLSLKTKSTMCDCYPRSFGDVRCKFEDCPYSVATWNKKHKKQYLPKINYIISNNIFSGISPYISDQECITLSGNYHKLSNIQISGNTFSDLNILGRIRCGSTVMLYKDNTISNIKSCIEYITDDGDCSNIIFENNMFNQVKQLYHDDQKCTVKLSDSNKFIDCGTELTKYVKHQIN